ncbi:hypothetical protein AMTR_s00080p00187510 [Amborella trichopoda]|uniref:Uncharacterized protein n=1 Tax=Amborella trichopoda TaxID=13333 RepID=W1PBJ7_AMBTC|nr:hypothetical protein AMTR_s00080p00187510 [Amborella trichopoda]
MYLMSTEKSVKLGDRKDLKATISLGASSYQCQKCFQAGQWTYECKNERVSISHPLRTQQLKNPESKMRLLVSYELDNPDNPLHGSNPKVGQSENSDGKSKKRAKKTKEKA